MGFFSGLFVKQNAPERANKDATQSDVAAPKNSNDLVAPVPADKSQAGTTHTSTQEPSSQEATLQSGQLDQSLPEAEEDPSLAMTKEDIIAAYKIFLKRPPESMEVVLPRVGLSADRILIDFFSSSEFLARPEAVKLIFTLAKKILDEKSPANAASTDNTTQAMIQNPTQVAMPASSTDGDGAHKG
jgi:hypothetical protein